MVFATAPQLGPGLEDVIAENGVWFDVPGKGTLISPELGSRQIGSDGHEYILCQASATIAAAVAPGTQVTITDVTFRAAAGAGGFFAPVGGVTDEGFFWARRNAL